MKIRIGKETPRNEDLVPYRVRAHLVDERIGMTSVVVIEMPDSNDSETGFLFDKYVSLFMTPSDVRRLKAVLAKLPDELPDDRTVWEEKFLDDVTSGPEAVK